MRHPSIPPAAPSLLALAPYQSARMLEAFDSSKTYLDANELPFAPPDSSIDFSEMQHYAHSGPQKMMTAFAEYVGVDPALVVATRGIDEGIDLLIRAYLEPRQDAILIQRPTYGMYEVCAAAHRVKTLELPPNELALPDLDALKSLDPLPKLIFLCRPNNPTGNLMPRETVETILEYTEGRCIVAVDEAYIEFCALDSVVPLLTSHPNLVVLRTLSKGFGLAGIHTGFLLAHEEIVNAVNRIANPYPIPEPCAQIALEALSASGLTRLQNQVSQVVSERNRLLLALQQHPDCQAVFASVTNFILSKWRSPAQPIEALRRQGILARPVQLPGETSPGLRISIGTSDEVDRVLAAI